MIRRPPTMKGRLNLATSSGRFVLVLFTNPDRYCAWFRTDIKAKATTGAPRSAIGDRIIALAVQSFALSQNAGRTCCDAKGASLTKMDGNLNIATIRVAHNTPPYSRLAELCQKSA
jgi:hypothetical protein